VYLYFLDGVILHGHFIAPFKKGSGGGRQLTVQSPVTEAIIFSIIPSTALPAPAQCQTSTTSWSGSIQTMFPPFPIAAKLEAGPLGHCFCFVLSHHS
jgi:hypothetical protein